MELSLVILLGTGGNFVVLEEYFSEKKNQYAHNSNFDNRYFCWVYDSVFQQIFFFAKPNF